MTKTNSSVHSRCSKKQAYAIVNFWMTFGYKTEMNLDGFMYGSLDRIKTLYIIIIKIVQMISVKYSNVECTYD